MRDRAEGEPWAAHADRCTRTPARYGDLLVEAARSPAESGCSTWIVGAAMWPWLRAGAVAPYEGETGVELHGAAWPVTASA